MSGTPLERRLVGPDGSGPIEPSVPQDSALIFGRLRNMIDRNALAGITPEDTLGLDRLDEANLTEAPLSRQEVILRMCRMFIYLGKYAPHLSVKELIEIQMTSNWARRYGEHPESAIMVSSTNAFEFFSGTPYNQGALNPVAFFRGFKRGVDLGYPELGPNWYLEMGHEGGGGDGPRHLAIPVEAVTRLKQSSVF